MGRVLLHDVIEAGAAQTPSQPALIVDGVIRDFAQVAADVAAFASGLAGLSRPGETVALLAPNGYAYPLAYYAVPRAGRVLLPLNQRLHPREWASQLERSRLERPHCRRQAARDAAVRSHSPRMRAHGGRARRHSG